MVAMLGNGTINVVVAADTTAMTYTLTAKFSGLSHETSSIYAPAGTPAKVKSGTMVMRDVSSDSNADYFVMLAGAKLFPSFAMNFYDVFTGSVYLPCAGPKNAAAAAAGGGGGNLRKTKHPRASRTI